MLIILDVRYSLGQITIWTDSRGIEAILDFAEKLFNNGNSVFTDNNTFHFLRFNLAVPLVVPDVIDCKSFDWISIEDFLDEFF
jgi:hypothetical protein